MKNKTKQAIVLWKNNSRFISCFAHFVQQYGSRAVRTSQHILFKPDCQKQGKSANKKRGFVVQCQTWLNYFAHPLFQWCKSRRQFCSQSPHPQWNGVTFDLMNKIKNISSEQCSTELISRMSDLLMEGVSDEWNLYAAEVRSWRALCSARQQEVEVLQEQALVSEESMHEQTLTKEIRLFITALFSTMIGRPS